MSFKYFVQMILPLVWGKLGFSVELPCVSGGKTMFTSECIVRSEGYYPPEIVMGKYSDRSDVYSFGVVSWNAHVNFIIRH